jgi:predicted cupin superfamily sugar epimerase
MTEVEKIVSQLQLSPHPEGGFFKEIYRSDLILNKSELSAEYRSDRNFSTSIYFLLTSSSFSAFHKIHQDEIWHFYKGDPIHLYLISPEGEHSLIEIGINLEAGQHPQFVVPGGYWFAAETIGTNGYSLVGCTVAPGFNFDDFTLPSRRELISKFPMLENMIIKFTRE